MMLSCNKLSFIRKILKIRLNRILIERIPLKITDLKGLSSFDYEFKRQIIIF